MNGYLKTARRTLLNPATVAIGMCIAIAGSIAVGPGLRSVALQIGLQTQLPLEEVALSVGAPAAAAASTIAMPSSRIVPSSTIAHKRFLRLQHSPAVRHLRGDFKDWT
ncbi:hypothetical protein BC1002_5409 [Paraburkholderia atlantica]|uniref:Uncharacterized protein n=1 Tax=Paraburkholderia atlantica TaxID=2654982 RepID=D5WFI5_PARAM|nr:hypothetical protein [Paraburkholderia atlantica]ADG19339.1 hypothetical protein BC1002_5409 [Paraburkholderia atlantica]